MRDIVPNASLSQVLGSDACTTFVGTPDFNGESIKVLEVADV
jgi:hypothetical protein